MSTEGGSKAVVAALLANLGIAVSKFVAFVFTGSSSMLAESIHSVADSGNQLLLLVGGRRARREADPEHPFGYGRARYIYAFIVAVVLFSVGGLFAIYEGYHKIHEALDGHGELVAPQWAIGVLVAAMCMEGLSFRTAIRESNPLRQGRSWLAFVRRARAPELPVVLLEDSAALLGLTVALVAVVASVVTGNAVYDGVGTIVIGALLVVVAVFLAAETSSLLLGEGATREDTEKIRAALQGSPQVERVIHMRTMHLGPEELLVAAKIAFRHDERAVEVARAIDDAEDRIRAAVPIARIIYLEPDIYSTEAAARGSDLPPVGGASAAH